MNHERRKIDRGRFLLLLCLSLLALWLVACSNDLAIPTDAPESGVLPTLMPMPTTVPGGLYVDASQNLGAISPYVYGSNYGPWLGITPNVYQQAVYARINFLRFPAGRWGDQNNVTELQIDQLIKLCKDLGCVPMINVRLENATPEQAADMVKYANFTKGYNIRYWGIGNEPNLYVGDYDIAQFNKDWRGWANAMRAIDPSILLVGPEISQFYPHPQNASQQEFMDWLVEFLKINGDMVDVVSVHRYPFPLSITAGPPSIDDLRDNTREWDEIIPTLRALVREHTGRDLPIGITEVNSSWANNNGGAGTMDSHYNAIWWGDVLGRMIRQGVDVVAQFALTRQWGILGQFEPHPLYFTYLMYQRFGIERVHASSDDPYVSIYAATRADGALTLMLINLTSEQVEKTLTLDNIIPTSAETWLFDADHPAERIEDTDLRATTQLQLSAESITLLIVPRQ